MTLFVTVLLRAVYAKETEKVTIKGDRLVDTIYVKSSQAGIPA